MSDFKDLTSELLKFRDERDWQKFHTSKDLALAITIEAAEIGEHFLWDRGDSIDQGKLQEEIADIVSYILLLANTHNIDIKEAVLAKLEKNRTRYPIDKAKGNATKYNQL